MFAVGYLVRRGTAKKPNGKVRKAQMSWIEDSILWYKEGLD